MFTFIYIVLALWVAAGIVQTYNMLKLLTPVAAEVLVKSWNFPDAPEIAQKVKALRADNPEMQNIPRKHIYWITVAMFYTAGALIGAKHAIKHKFKPAPKWEKLMKDVHIHNPVNRF